MLRNFFSEGCRLERIEFLRHMEGIMPGHDIIVVGASAGGVEALVTLTRLLPRNLPAAVFVVLHIPAQSPSFLPDILNRAGVLKAAHATDNLEIKHSRIY